MRIVRIAVAGLCALLLGALFVASDGLAVGGMCPVQKTRTVTKYRTEQIRECTTKYRVETYTVPVQKTRTVTKYRTVTWQEAVTRYRTETYTVQVPQQRCSTRSYPVTSCSGWGRWRRCSTTWKTERYCWTVYVTETRTRQVPYTEWVTRTVSIPYTETETYTAYETRWREVPYQDCQTRTVSVPYQVTETYTDYAPCGDPPAGGCPGCNSGSGRVNTGPGSNSPIPGMPYRPTDQTLIIKTPDGRIIETRQAVFTSNPDGSGPTWGALDVTNDPQTRQMLENAGFTVTTTGDGTVWVLTDHSRTNPGLNATIDWQATPGQNASNNALVCQSNPAICGGVMTIVLGYGTPPQEPQAPPAGQPPAQQQTAPPPSVGNPSPPVALVRSVSTAPDPVTEGQTCTVTATVDGSPTSVQAAFDWGATVNLTDGGGGRWTGGDVTPPAPGAHTVTVTATDGVMTSSRSATCNVAPAPAAITGVTAQPNPVRFGDWLTLTVTTSGRVDRVTARVNHRRTDLPANRFDYALTRTSGAPPGTQTWSARIRVDWITPEEYQVAMCQQDGSQQWVDVCGRTIPAYPIAITASGTGGTATSSTSVTVQGTTVWVVPVPAGK